ncbi:MAG: zinc metalloprotease HtpX [Candidatus Terrybacteria bacterium RIFCSPLOWO2_01_FULL_58_14]|uniref:Protease HtpX homolog n=2 Tax=Candidatus Terryibacteriota TaxID=1817920 RepID=A0A1G2PVQ6_9BACT|nr:MAG: zinc metalloprotease HtpX [Candidatus Terrybacteria bacterium RIFCSPHIGHO2_01_FULL_58_15]OHA52414.1 MAG: zinc metalloprotease HtpX [Candidatus Terrybacteria bacterium RIFCSPLOWO2_01_FULL_58_14]
MATLYTHRAENIRATWLLFGAFVVLIAGVGWVVSYAYDAYIIFPIAVAIAVFMSVASYWFSDKMVVAFSGAKPVLKQDDPELYRTVENLAIAAGLPAPKIYIVEDPAPNAFATGRDPNHAVIAVTRGLRQGLEKPELEGVLAHELAHIGNNDMFIATVAAVLAGVIATLADLFIRMTFHGGFGGSRRDRRGSGGALILVGLIGALVLAPIAATLLRLAISRRREFLADASGALLTRHPEALAQALEKISAFSLPMRRAPEAIAHLWLSDPQIQKHKASFFSRLFMTHPPLEDRIRALRKIAA